MCFERSADSPFDPATATLLEQIGLLLGPVIGLRHRENRSFMKRMTEDVVAAPLRRLFGPGSLGVKMAAVSLLLLLGVAGFNRGEFRVTAPGGLEGVVQQVIVAPFDGYLAQTHIRAGETVESGQVVARLDDRELNLEHQKWRGKREEYARHYRKALAGLDHSQARIFKTQLAQADAQLTLLREQLDRTRLLAPFDGLDEMRDDAEDRLNLNKAMIGSTVALSTGLSVGYVAWLIRSGALLSGLLTSLPTWQFVDPMPVLAFVRKQPKQERDQDDDDSLESMVSALDDEESPDAREPQQG